jgi:hypothetical protein
MAKAAKLQAEPEPSNKIVVLAKDLMTLKKRHEKLKAEATTISKRISEIEELELAKLMQEAELPQIKVEGVGTFFIQDVFFANVNKDDRIKFYAWLRENGHGSIVQDYVFPGTITSFAKELAANNEALPDMIKVAVVPTVRTRSAH